MITTGHLCSGYDGIGRGLTQAGLAHRALWHAEVDTDASATLAKHEPDVRNVGDLKTVPWHLAPRVDLMTSGDPCQSISVAGRQRGRKDPRFLWPHVRAAYRAVAPGAILLENVQGIVSHDEGRTLAERLADLREDGYAARWTVMGACAVGAPHHRHRWFLLAARHSGPARTPEAVRIGTTALCGAPRSGGRPLLPTPRTTDMNGAARAANLQGGVDLRTAVSLLPTGPNRWGRYAEAVALWESITGAPAPIPVEAGPKGGPRMSALLPEWMMGLPAGTLTGHLPRSPAIKQAGNGAVPQQAAAAWRILTRE